MKKTILVLTCLIIVACNEKVEDFKQMDFYGKKIHIPAYMSKVDLNKDCSNNIKLTNKEESVSMSYQLCDYRSGKRQSFDKLNMFFKEEFMTMKEEKPEISWIGNDSLNKDGYYEFMYEYKVDDKYHRAVYIAYEKYFLVIRIDSNNKNQIKELAESTDILRDSKFLDDVVISKEESENYCLNCKFPTFW